MQIIEEQSRQKNVWISTTGYRIFLELKLMLEAPVSSDELIEIIKQDRHLNKEVSKDTIRCDIDTLINAGCKIIKPSKKTSYKYVLVSHPFKLDLKLSEINILNELRKILALELSLNEVFILNDLYEKIASLTFDEKKEERIKNSKLLPDIDRNIVRELSNPALKGKKVNIKYKSPEYGVEDTDISPVKIIYENEKAYLEAYNYKYKAQSYFEISKVLKINSVSMNTEDIAPASFNAVYEVFGSALHDFELKPYEKIIEKTPDKIRVEAEAPVEFMFIQRLLLLGRNFRIISPDFFREKLINKIKAVQKRYQND